MARLIAIGNSSSTVVLKIYQGSSSSQTVIGASLTAVEV